MKDQISQQLETHQDMLTIAPFRDQLQPIIEESLAECSPSFSRKGMVLRPVFTIWFILTMSIHRHLDYRKVMNVVIQSVRWLSLFFPANIVTTSAISYARRRMGIKVFGLIFKKIVQSYVTLEADFHGMVSLGFDGVLANMPDTKKNTKKFKKPHNDHKESGFPVVRIMTLMVLSTRFILDMSFASYKGKRTGEQTLMMKIIKRFQWLDQSCLFLFDAIFYSFSLMLVFEQNNQNFLMKVSSTVPLRRIKGKTFPDGSYLAKITKKIVDPDACPQKKRKRRKEHTIIVRVVQFKVSGFPPTTLITNLLDLAISADELVIHYHLRWEIEIGYYEIKTNQCATMRGQAPTIFRSKRPELVIQELYAILINYNMIRLLISQSLEESQITPLEISFLDTLYWLLECSKKMNSAQPEHQEKLFQYLLKMIIKSPIDRPRRPRKNPRVIKERKAKFKVKRKENKGVVFEFEKEFTVIPPVEEKLPVAEEEDYSPYILAPQTEQKKNAA